MCKSDFILLELSLAIQKFIFCWNFQLSPSTNSSTWLTIQIIKFLKVIHPSYCYAANIVTGEMCQDLDLLMLARHCQRPVGEKCLPALRHDGSSCVASASWKPAVSELGWVNWFSDRDTATKHFITTRNSVTRVNKTADASAVKTLRANTAFQMEHIQPFHTS